MREPYFFKSHFTSSIIPFLYVADESLAVGVVYQIPEEIFENVIMTHFKVNKEELRRKTTYNPEKAAYEYRPRGFYEAEYPDIPYPEVVSYDSIHTENNSHPTDGLLFYVNTP